MFLDLTCLFLSADWIPAGLKARGVRTDAHVSVNSVVERMLAAEAEEAATSVDSLPSPETATSPHLPAPSKQKQGDLTHSWLHIHVALLDCIYIYQSCKAALTHRLLSQDCVMCAQRTTHSSICGN